jgi:parallel beta-helix repeat protein
MSVSGCFLTKNLKSGITITNSSDLVISESLITDTLPLGDESGGVGISISESSRVSLKSVQIQSSGRGDEGQGMSLARTSGISVDHSAVSKSSGSGIETIGETTGLLIQNSEILSNGGDGISLGSGCLGPVLSTNRVAGNRLVGIEVMAGRHGIITGNTVESGQVGLSLSGSEDFSLSSNQFRNNIINLDITGTLSPDYYHTIDTSNQAEGKPVLYLRNKSGISITPMDNPSCVILVQCSGISLSDLVLSRNGAGILLVDSDNISISRAAVLYNLYGIRAHDRSQDITISHCNAEKNIIAGYSVNGSENVTFYADSALNNLLGYQFTNSREIVVQNSQADNQEGIRRRGPSGFQIVNSSSIILLNNTAEQNQFNGVYLKDTINTTLVNNSFSQNDIAGVAIVSGKGAELRDNIIASNSAGGILVYGNDSVIHGNFVMNNKGRGISIDGSAGDLIFDNYLNNSKNIELSGYSDSILWNITPQQGFTVIQTDWTGGNYWGAPDGRGFSDLCNQGKDGFCSSLFRAGEGNIDYHPLKRPGRDGNDLNGLEMEEIAGETMFDQAGDFNKNGRLDLQDVVLFMDAISSDSFPYSGLDVVILYDYSRDGRLNLKDVVSFFKKVQDFS